MLTTNAKKIAWSIKIATKGVEGFIDELLGSDEYMENFGYDIVPYYRRRILPGREVGQRPFDIKSPRYNEYYRGIFGLPPNHLAGSGSSLQASGKRSPVLATLPCTWIWHAASTRVQHQRLG